MIDAFCIPRWLRGEDCDPKHKHTPREWERDPRYTMMVMDPDGWRFWVRPDLNDKSTWLPPRDFDDPITRKEYEMRAGPSTMMDKREWEQMWEDRRRKPVTHGRPASART